jgi:hypothetical protein
VKKHVPIKLGPTERVDLGSITKHPGMTVLLERIGKGHADQQLLSVLDVEPDDPERVVKIDAISSVAYAMKLFLELLRKEVVLNWEFLQQQEVERQKEAKKKAPEARTQ